MRPLARLNQAEVEVLRQRFRRVQGWAWFWRGVLSGLVLLALMGAAYLLRR